MRTPKRSLFATVAVFCSLSLILPLPASPALQPLFVRQDIATHFQFRIRNLPYDYDNYIVEIDEAVQEIVLKTKNKKSATARPRQPTPGMHSHSL
jgi:hypothetical protein